MLNPKCFKCDSGITKFRTRTFNQGANQVIILFCSECGAVQGVTLK